MKLLLEFGDFFLERRVLWRCACDRDRDWNVLRSFTCFFLFTKFQM